MTRARQHAPSIGDVLQYVFFNKSPTASGPMAWRQTVPDSSTAASCREIVENAGTRGNDYLEQWPNDPSHDPSTSLLTRADDRPVAHLVVVRE